jgi:excisionase family DNA binding protein
VGGERPREAAAFLKVSIHALAKWRQLKTGPSRFFFEGPKHQDILIQMTNDDLLTIPEAAQRIRVSRATLFKFIKEGRLQVVRLSARKVLIRREELEKFIRESEK